jgi:hypothetical protein
VKKWLATIADGNLPTNQNTEGEEEAKKGRKII